MLAHSIKDEAMHFSVVKARPLTEMLDYELMVFDNLVRVHSFLHEHSILSLNWHAWESVPFLVLSQ